MSIEAMKEMANYIDTLGGDSKKYRQAIEQAEKQDVPEVGFGNMEPVAWMNTENVIDKDYLWDEKITVNFDGDGQPLYTTPPAAQRQQVVFPTMLRKMWSGGEVQAWLDENVNKEKNT